MNSVLCVRFNRITFDSSKLINYQLTTQFRASNVRTEQLPGGSLRLQGGQERCAADSSGGCREERGESEENLHDVVV